MPDKLFPGGRARRSRRRSVVDRAGEPDYKPALPSLPWAGSAQVAQLVEHATENRSVGGSIPPLGTIQNLAANRSDAIPFEHVLAVLTDLGNVDLGGVIGVLLRKTG